ncbi:MAG TPA: GNAT family N-acetyltransferase [Candidatus Saccharimonadales bacterium]|nr:GNAT family N-acetyltransferase [Candidatus Saccharimonadales bacterium]
MRAPLYLSTERPTIALCEMVPSNAPAYFAALDANREFLQQYGNDTGARYPTLASAEAAIATYKDTVQSTGELWMGIWHDFTLIGSIDARPYLDGQEIGYWLGEQYTGRGYATTAVKSLVRYLKVKNESIYARVDARHLASIGVLERTRFEHLADDQGERTYVHRRLPAAVLPPPKT